MLHHSRSSTAAAVNSHPTLWALAGLPSDSALKLEAWLDSLAELSLTEWMHIGRTVGSRPALMTLGSACRGVDDLIERQSLGLEAWLIRDLVETTTYHIERAASRLSRRAQSELAIARMAAEWAALGVAVESWLPADQLSILIRPFTRATYQLEGNPVPVSSLTGSGRASSSVAIPGTRRAKTLPPPSRSRSSTSPP